MKCRWVVVLPLCLLLSNIAFSQVKNAASKVTNATLFKHYPADHGLLGATAATITETSLSSNIGYSRIEFYKTSGCTGTAFGAVVLNKGEFPITQNVAFKLNASTVYTLAQAVVARVNDGTVADDIMCIRISVCNKIVSEGYPSDSNVCAERGSDCPTFNVSCSGSTCEGVQSKSIDYTAGSGSNYCASSGSSQVYAKVGDLTYGGVVAGVGTTGVENIVTPEVDQNGGMPIQWFNATTVIGASAQSTTDGASNAAAIVSAYGTSVEYAARTCDEESLITSLGQTPTDWFLPASEQLAQLYDAKATIGGFVNARYWSSSENTAPNQTKARTRNFTAGGVTGNTKTATNYIRCVRPLEAP